MARPKAIVKLEESPTEGKRNWLVYADSGEGKTALAGTAPNALFITTEAAGTESAKALGSTADEWVCDTKEEFDKAFQYVKKEGFREYEWVLVDSISEVEELVWTEQLESAHKKNKSRSLFQPAIADYQIVGNKMKRIVDQFNRLPINVLYTAQTMRVDVESDNGEDDDVSKLMPLVGSVNNGVISQKICGKVTLVGLLQARPVGKGKTERRLYVQGNKRFIAKDRHDAFDRFLVDTNIASMAAAVDARQASAGAKATPKKKKKEQ